MLKDQNGYPRVKADISNKDEAIRTNSGCNTDDTNGKLSYEEASKRLVGAPLAYVYAPSQPFRLLYSAKQALAHGTLFEELYKPMEVYGNE